MAKIAAKTLTATTTPTFLCNIVQPRDRNSWLGTIDVKGAFGGNASNLVNIYLTDNQGTTTSLLRTNNGVLTSTGAPYVFSPIQLGSKITNVSTQLLQLYVSMTPVGADASVTVDVYDNN